MSGRGSRGGRGGRGGREGSQAAGRRNVRHRAAAKPGPKKYQSRKPAEDREVRFKKWLHHNLKTLQKELKKSKVYETRKIMRRINQVEKKTVNGGDDNETAAASAKRSAAILDKSKLEAQLTAVKALDLQRLAHKVADSAGLLEMAGPEVTSPAQPDATAASPGAEANQSALQVVSQRVIKAKCVREQLQACIRDYQKLFAKSMGKLVAIAGSSDDPDSDVNASDDLKDGLSGGEEEQHGSGSEGEEDDAPVDEPTPEVLTLLEKLKAAKSKAPPGSKQALDAVQKEGVAVQGGNYESSDDDSGVMEVDEDDIGEQEDVEGAQQGSDGLIDGDGDDEADGGTETRAKGFRHPLLGKRGSRNDDDGSDTDGDGGGGDSWNSEDEDRFVERGTHSNDDDGRQDGDDASDGTDKAASGSDDENGLDDGDDVREQMSEDGSESGSDDSFNSEDFDQLVPGEEARPKVPKQEKELPKGLAKESKVSKFHSKDAKVLADQKGGRAAAGVDKEGKRAGDKKGKSLSKKALGRIDRYLKAHDPLLGKAKNRLGQKARRALYEKKYGNSARHIVEHQQHRQQVQGSQIRGRASAPGRGNGGSERGPTSAGRGSNGGGIGSRGDAAAAPGAGRPTRPGTKAGDQKGGTVKSHTGAEALHPSWAARKAGKEKLSISVVVPVAKKIKFDDDGGAKMELGPRGEADGGRGESWQGGQGQDSGSGFGRGRGAGRSGDRGGRGGRGGSVFGGGAHGRGDGGRGSDRHDGRGAAADKAMHPSWAAKQKLKQQQTTLVPATGKKIVFDD